MNFRIFAQFQWLWLEKWSLPLSMMRIPTSGIQPVDEIPTSTGWGKIPTSAGWRKSQQVDSSWLMKTWEFQQVESNWLMKSQQVLVEAKFQQVLVDENTNKLIPAGWWRCYPIDDAMIVWLGIYMSWWVGVWIGLFSIACLVIRFWVSPLTC